jgi:hypothetical protein
VLCPSCGHENRDDGTFCLKRSGRVAVTWPSCQRPLPPEAEFRDAGRKELRGIAGRQRVYGVVW